MSALRWLGAESLVDAFRRRIVPVICVFALLSLFMVDGCTSCAPTVTGPDGEPLSLPELSGGTGMIMLALLGLWTAILAGVLASDHLAEPLADGSANLVLARPVSRGAFASARLLGAWGLAATTGVLLIGAAALLLATRQGLSPAPVLVALLFVLANALTVAALAMLLSLGLGRTLTALAVFGAVWGIAFLELLALLDVELGLATSAIATGGPPLLGGVVAPLVPWLGPSSPLPAPPEWVLVRAIAWAVASVSGLALAFRRVELGR